MFKGRMGDLCPGLTELPHVGVGKREGRQVSVWDGAAAIDVVEGGGSRGPVSFWDIVIC